MLAVQMAVNGILTLTQPIFIGRIENLTAMYDMGLFINDLSIHDSSRDLVLASTQQQTELKRALAQVSNSKRM